MATTFKILFQVKILHHFFLNKGLVHFEGMNDREKMQQLNRYDIHKVFSITPTASSRKKLSGYKLIFKKTPTGFIVGTPTESGDPTKPFSTFTEKDLFTFEIRVNDAFLFNYSALPLQDTSGQIYYFHNRDKSAFQFPNIAALANEFDSSAASAAAGDGDPDTFAYYPGDLLIDDASDPALLFECIKSTNSNTTTNTDWREDAPASDYDNSTSYAEGNVVQFESGGKKALYKAKGDTTGNNPTDTSNWEKLLDLPLYYANNTDAIKVGAQLFQYSFTAPGLEVAFEIADTYGNVVKTEEAESTTDTMSHVLDLRGFPQGQYSLKATNISTAAVIEEFDFYLLPEKGPSGLFGIIDVFSGDDEGDFSLVEADNTLKSPEFILRIKNRSTIWRYINGKDREVQHETESNPLTHSGNIEVIFDGEERPNPSANIIKPEPQQYYSEVYL